MAKQRMINTKFWTDTYVEKLDPIERLVFIYLLTNTNTNISGIYEITVKRVAFDVGLDISVATNILNRLESDGKIKRENGFIAIKNFIKHQAINPKVQAGINYELAGKPQGLIDFVNIGVSKPVIKIRRKKISKTLRNEVFARDENMCKHCGESKRDLLEIDHILPVRMGGTSDTHNLQILCRKCNGGKNAHFRWENNGDVEYSPPIFLGGLSHTNTNTNTNIKREEDLSSTNKVSFTQQDVNLTKLLLEYIVSNNPTFKEPNLDSWANHIRLMRERDNRTEEQIKFIIKWSQENNFWSANILSTKKLREKFDTLVAQAKRDIEKDKIKKQDVIM